MIFEFVYTTNAFISELEILVISVFFLAFSGVHFSCNMRLLWVAVVLALFKCNEGQEDSTVSEDLIKELFSNNTDIFENKSGATPGDPPPQPLPPQSPPSGNPNGEETTCSSCAAIAEDPTLTPKVSNVSQSYELSLVRVRVCLCLCVINRKIIPIHLIYRCCFAVVFFFLVSR